MAVIPRWLSLTARLAMSVLLLVNGAALAATTDPAHAAPATPPTHLRVAIDLWPGYYPVVIAKSRGLFAARGLDVDYFVPENTGHMLDEFVAGKIDVVCVAMGDAITLKARAPSLKVVLISDESAGGDALLSLQPLPASLTGLRIGTNLNGFGELLVREFVRQHGGSIDDIQLVQQDAADAAKFLEQKKVDIAHTWEPYVSQASSYLGAEVVFSSAKTPGLIPDAVVMHGKLLDKPGAARAFVAAWLEAAQWWLDNRHAGNRLVESELLQMPNTVNLEGIRLFDLTANRTALERGDTMQSLYFSAGKYLDYFKSKHSVPDHLTPDDILEPGLLPEMGAK